MAPSFDTFRPFPKLPIELRAKIWDEACSSPRVIEMQVTEFTHKGLVSCTYTSTTPVPSTLNASRESRQYSLKHYTLAFGSPRDSLYQNVNTVYINFKKDTVYFSWRTGIDEFGSTRFYNIDHLDKLACNGLYSIGKITSIALNLGFAKDQRTTNSSMYGLAKLPKLKELILVGGERETEEDEDENEDEDESGHRSLCQVGRYNRRVFFADPEADEAVEWEPAALNMRQEFKDGPKIFPGNKISKPIVTLKVLFRDRKGAYRRPR